MPAAVPNPIAPSLIRFLRGYVWFAAAASLLVGVTVLVGWAVDSHAMKAVLPHLVEMKANTGLGFVMCGLALGLRHGQFGTPGARVASALSMLMALLGAATLFEYVTKVDLGIDQILFKEAWGAFGTTAPGRMALTSTLAFMTTGFSLLLVENESKSAQRVGQYCALGTALCGWPTAIGYAYGLRAFFGLASYTQMALHTAVTFSLVAPALLALRPTCGFVPTFLGQRSGSQMARPLVLAAIFVPAILGRIALWGERLHHFDHEFGFSAHVIVNIIFFVVLAALLAHALNQTDGARERAEDDLRRAHHELEERVSQRTLDLNAANAALVSEVQERQRAAEALRVSESKFRSVIESARSAIVIANSAGKIMSWNGAAQKIFGYTAAEVIGQPLSMLTPSDLRQVHDRGLARVAAGGPTKSIGQATEVPGLHRDGQIVPLELSLTTWEQDGERFFSGILTDITIRKQAQAAITAAKEQAEAANRAKSEFLANMSHEIRTPLNGIIGMTELTLDTQLSAHQRDNLETVASSAEALLEVVNDVLDFSKIEAGRLSLEEIAFDPRHVVNRTVGMLLNRASQKGLRLESKLATSVPYGLIGDPLRLRQVLLNLVSNAIKFTKTGEVCVRASGRPISDSIVRMHFSVSDTGMGIPADKQDLIFAAFSQADTSTTRRYGGTGLGLTISSKLVAFMGGKLSVASKVGVGSTFEFQVDLAIATLPSVAADGELIGNETHRRLQATHDNLTAIVGRNILLVEDNAVNQRVATGMLVAAGHRVTVAGNGQVALERMQEGLFDVVLMDVQMPVMDGFCATRAWRARESQLGGAGRLLHLPIIAMTAHALAGDEADCLTAGMNDYLTKPVERVLLLSKIAFWTRGDRPAALAVAKPIPWLQQEGVMDREAFLREMDHDSVLVTELVALFCKDSRSQLSTIRQALACGQPQMVAATAHSLKGAIAHFRAPRAFRAAASLEELAAQGNLVAATDSFANLDREVALLTAALPDLSQQTHPH